MDCIFCKIIAGDIPSYKLYEDELVMAFLDINPYLPGHTLIVPKKHVLDIKEIDEDLLNHIMKVAKELAIKITDRLSADGFTLVQNNGFVQEVKHFHLHVIPKYINEKNMDLEEVYKKITQAE